MQAVKFRLEPGRPGFQSLGPRDLQQKDQSSRGSPSIFRYLPSSASCVSAGEFISVFERKSLAMLRLLLLADVLRGEAGAAT